LQETEHFWRWRQKQVAKIVWCGEPHDTAANLLCSRRQSRPVELFASWDRCR